MPDGPLSRARRETGTIVAVALIALLTVATITAGRSRAAVGVRVSVLATSEYGRVLVVGGGTFKDFPLYVFSGDGARHFGCGVGLALGSDLGAVANQEMTCTGPMSDLSNSVTSDDWPALTSAGPPVAGPGVKRALLSTVDRPGIGHQVTYAGHPLYLFDPASAPFAPEGVRYMETEQPLAPWHGTWYLVSAATGDAVAGPAVVLAGRLGDGERVLSVRTDENVHPLQFAAYEDSADTPTASACAGACARTWLPVITTGRPIAGPGVASSALGVITRPDGTVQVTYLGHPLYLYALERLVVVHHSLLPTGTAGNGEGRSWGAGRFRLVPL